MTVSLQLWWVGIVSYLICHFFHVHYWRKNIGNRKLITLCAFFLFAPIVVYLSVLFQTPDVGAWLVALGTHVVLSINYIAIYPAFQASSPTIQILCSLSKHSEGLTKEQVIGQLAAETILEERITDLETSSLLTKQNSHYLLTQKGNLLASVFLIYRRFIGLPMGEG